MQRIDNQNLSETGWMVIERLTERLKALATFSVEDLLLLSKSYQKEIKWLLKNKLPKQRKHNILLCEHLDFEENI